MKHQKLLSLMLSLMLATSLLAACGGGAPTATPTPEPTATPKMCQTVTCAMAIRAMAWIDLNADGVQDTGEPPLPGVRFRRAGEDFWSEVSDESGWVTVVFMFAGDPVPCESLFLGDGDSSCDLATDRVLATGRVKGRPFDVEPEIPSGYRLNTSGGAYGFGFAPLAPTATLTP